MRQTEPGYTVSMTEAYTWTADDEDEAVRGLAQLGEEFPGVSVTIRWYGRSGPGVTHLTAEWNGRVVMAYAVEGLRESLLRT